MEFYTGVALFQTHDNLEHLAMMEAVMGKMPELFARRGARTKPEFFKEGNKLDWPKAKASRQSKRDVRATRALRVSNTDFLLFPSHTKSGICIMHTPVILLSHPISNLALFAPPPDKGG